MISKKNHNLTRINIHIKDHLSGDLKGLYFKAWIRACYLSEISIKFRK